MNKKKSRASNLQVPSSRDSRRNYLELIGSSLVLPLAYAVLVSDELHEFWGQMKNKIEKLEAKIQESQSAWRVAISERKIAYIRRREMWIQRRATVESYIGKQVSTLESAVTQAVRLAASKTSPTAKAIIKLVERVLLALGKAFLDAWRTLDASLNEANKILLILRAGLKRLSARLRLLCEGVIERGPIRFIRADGRIHSWAGRSFTVIDLTNLPPERLERLISSLHEMGPGVATKVIWEGAISGTTVDQHVSWLLNQSRQNSVLYKELWPNSQLSYDLQLRWYLEVMESIKRGHRVLRPLLVLPSWTLETLTFLKPYRLQPLGLMLFLLGQLDLFSDSFDQAFRESHAALQETHLLDAIAPDNITFFDDGVAIKKEARWHLDDRLQERRGYLYSFQIHGCPPISQLRRLLLPWIRDDRRLYIASSIQPVPDDEKSKFLNITGRRMRIAVGIHEKKAQINSKSTDSSYETYEEVVADSLDKFEFRYWQNVSRILDLIADERRNAFRQSSLTIVLKASTPADLIEFQKSVLKTLKDEYYWCVEEKQWLSQEQNFHNVLPVVTNREVRERTLRFPAADTTMLLDLYHETLSIQQDELVLGILEEADAPGVPFGFGKTIVGATGEHTSGKTFAAQIYASWFPLPDPRRRIIVVVNTGVAKLVDGLSTAVDEARQKAWSQWAKQVGGKSVYAANYKTPEEVYQELLAVEQNRYIVYYGDQSLKQHDLVGLQWVYDALHRFHQPDVYDEDYAEQMLVLDDILLWNIDQDYPDNPGHRMDYVSNILFNQCMSTGTLTFFTLQTPAAIEKANPAAHAILSTGAKAWMHFVTPTYGDIADAIGVRRHTAEGSALADAIESSLKGIVPLGAGMKDRGRCLLTFHNVRKANARTIVHPEMVPLLSRMKTTS